MTTVFRSKYYKDNPETKRRNNLRRRTIDGKRVYLPAGSMTVSAQFSVVDPLLLAIREDIRKIAEASDRRVAESVKRGFVYVISNPAWPEWVSVGQTTDYIRRLVQYNRSCPFSAFRVEYTAYFEDRRAAEERAHQLVMWESAERRGEWFKISIDRAVHCVRCVQREFNEQNRDTLFQSTDDRGASASPNPLD